MRVGRNETCPCGSGKKFKNCCAHKARSAGSRGLVILLVVIGVIAAIGVYPLVVKQESDTAIPAAAAGRPGTAQPGPAPPGKVWSIEHGHWHDVTTTPAASTEVQPSTPAPNPQPPGAIPPGKVWSPEHGHWHDAPKK